MSSTLLPLVMPTVLKLFAALLRVMLLAAPAARVVVPVTVSWAALGERAMVVTPKVPETVEAPKINALASVSSTLLPLVMPTVPKLLRGVIEGDVVGGAGGEGRGAGDGHWAALGEGAVGGHP